MLDLSKIKGFEWDKGNIDKSWIKHKISNRESEEVFVNDRLLVSEDEKHSKTEKRFQAIGKTNMGRLLFLSFTVRRRKIRIISSRPISRKERKNYAKTEEV